MVARGAWLGAGAAGLSLALELVRVPHDQGWTQPFQGDPSERPARCAPELGVPERGALRGLTSKQALANVVGQELLLCVPHQLSCKPHQALLLSATSEISPHGCPVDGLHHCRETLTQSLTQPRASDMWPLQTTHAVSPSPLLDNPCGAATAANYLFRRVVKPRIFLPLYMPITQPPAWVL